MSKDKIVWNINTGHPETVHESPLEPGVWHMPSDVCEVEPPSFNDETHSCKYDGSKWVIEKDKRFEEMHLEELNEKYPNGPE